MDKSNKWHEIRSLQYQNYVAVNFGLSISLYSILESKEAEIANVLIFFFSTLFTSYYTYMLRDDGHINFCI